MTTDPPPVTAHHVGETVAEAVRRQLLDAILFGDLATPTRLFPTELAKRFDVSITPVREALSALASEGFIEAIPRRGYHVRAPTTDYITELWSIRQALELAAGEAVLQHFTDRTARAEALTPLSDIHHKLAGSAALSQRDHVALNGQFHDTLVQLSGNRLLVGMYSGIRLRLFVAWVQRGTRAWRSRLAGEQSEHAAILDALLTGDRPAFDEAVRRHLARSLRDALADLDRQQRHPTSTNDNKEDRK